MKRPCLVKAGERRTIVRPIAQLFDNNRRIAVRSCCSFEPRNVAMRLNRRSSDAVSPRGVGSVSFTAIAALITLAAIVACAPAAAPSPTAKPAATAAPAAAGSPAASPASAPAGSPAASPASSPAASPAAAVGSAPLPPPITKTASGYPNKPIEIVLPFPPGGDRRPCQTDRDPAPERAGATGGDQKRPGRRPAHRRAAIPVITARWLHDGLLLGHSAFRECLRG